MAKTNKSMQGEELLGKAMKKVSKETEKGVEKEDDEPAEYEMPLKEAVAEHERLIKVLETGTDTQRKQEANRQKKELAKMKK